MNYLKSLFFINSSVIAVASFLMRFLAMDWFINCPSMQRNACCRFSSYRCSGDGYQWYRCIRPLFTGSAVALHCCKAHSKSIGKMENSTPCKIVTPENFILKLGIRDYVENVTHYTNFHIHRFSGGFSTNRWNITLLWLFFLSCPVHFFSHTRPARTARPIFAVYGSNDVVPPKDGPFWG